MVALHPKFIINEQEEKTAVILPFKEWVELLEKLEDLEDVKAYDLAKLDTEDETIPFEHALSELAED